MNLDLENRSSSEPHDSDNSVKKGPRRVTQKYFCSIEVAVDCIGGKWKPTLIYYLKEGPKRFGELRKSIPRASKKVIVSQLRELEADGLVNRVELNNNEFNGTMYALTEVSMELLPALQLLHEWGLKQAQRKNIVLELPSTD